MVRGDLPVGLHTACLGTLAFSGFFLSTWSCWNISVNLDSYLKGKSLAVELLEETRRNILVCSPEQFSSRSSAPHSCVLLGSVPGGVGDADPATPLAAPYSWRRQAATPVPLAPQPTPTGELGNLRTLPAQPLRRPCCELPGPARPGRHADSPALGGAVRNIHIPC